MGSLEVQKSSQYKTVMPECRSDEYVKIRREVFLLVTLLQLFMLIPIAFGLDRLAMKANDRPTYLYLRPNDVHSQE